MKCALLLSAASLGAAQVVPAALALLGSRDESDYINSVCSPAVNATSGGTIPPCIEVTTIEAACAPNGTSPLALDAHAQCLCHGSYFADWAGCQQCLLVHGARSPRDMAFYSSVLTVASNALCTGTPTAPFVSLFSSAQASVTQPSTGATTSSDSAPSNAAVSLYFTASGSVGPGVITGSATAATATGPTVVSGSSSRGGSSTGASSQKASSSGASTGSSAASSASATASSSTSKAAAPTAAVAEHVLFAAAAGGALLAAAL